MKLKIHLLSSDKMYQQLLLLIHITVYTLKIINSECIYTFFFY